VASLEAALASARADHEARQSAAAERVRRQLATVNRALRRADVATKRARQRSAAVAAVNAAGIQVQAGNGDDGGGGDGRGGAGHSSAGGVLSDHASGETEIPGGTLAPAAKVASGSKKGGTPARILSATGDQGDINPDDLAIDGDGDIDYDDTFGDGFDAAEDGKVTDLAATSGLARSARGGIDSGGGDGSGGALLEAALERLGHQAQAAAAEVQRRGAALREYRAELARVRDDLRRADGAQAALREEAARLRAALEEGSGRARALEAALAEAREALALSKQDAAKLDEALAEARRLGEVWQVEEGGRGVAHGLRMRAGEHGTKGHRTFVFSDA